MHSHFKTFMMFIALLVATISTCAAAEDQLVSGRPAESVRSTTAADASHDRASTKAANDTRQAPEEPKASKETPWWEPLLFVAALGVIASSVSTSMTNRVAAQKVREVQERLYER